MKPRAPAKGRSHDSRKPPTSNAPRHGLARVLSKQGVCSRTEAARWIQEGRVEVDGRIVRDPEFPIRRDGSPRILVDGRAIDAAPRLYLMLNKPRGLVTSTQDERGRDTVYRCFDGAGLPWLAPVGRLDKASEGLLLFTNDPAWAAGITDPQTGPAKTYHVQVDTVPDERVLATLVDGVEVEGERLHAASVRLLRSGERNAWLEIVLDEGRNRQIRRLLGAVDIAVLRLVRVAIGALALGELPKGQWRELTSIEAEALFSNVHVHAR
ncbi:pseudouridine synthase [Lysobacter auxotrophicus]|uniref:Pseudouridine synthase n=1 Tax=Lysobacter auxotrophicus TaxID=2992573 RepID=A0ABN6UHR2_9GAMM|nr:rRNA pseudouridine synthase [Lysobacter auxotrophicus]